MRLIMQLIFVKKNFYSLHFFWLIACQIYSRKIKINYSLVQKDDFDLYS